MAGEGGQPMEQDTKQAAGVVLARLSAVVVGEGIAHERMVLFPLFAEDGDGSSREAFDYRTIEEAIAEGWVEVSEQPAATVPELVLWNKSTAIVLVLDGEEIVGGRQNRIVNVTFLVGAGAKATLPVSCVEHGRWHEVSPRFAPGEVSYFSLKREKHEQVRANLRASGQPMADQSAIWGRLAERHAAARTDSATGAMDDLYKKREEALAGYARAFAYVVGAVGMIVALDGGIAGAEIFDQSRTAAALWPKLVRSYALDAPDGSGGALVEHGGAVGFLARTQGARCEVYPSLALGEDVRLEGDGVIGAALVYRSVPVHIGLFRTRDGSASGRGGMVAASLRRRFRSRPTGRGQATGDER